MESSFRLPTFDDILGVEPLYDNLPYHNFGHALTVYSRAIELGNQIILEGGKVNLPVVAWAALLHDTNMAKELEGSGFKTKEGRSAVDAEIHLASLGASDSFGRCVGGVIIDGTLRNGFFGSTEAQVVRAADLHTIGGEYHEFFAANMNVYREECLLKKKGIPFQDWKSGMVKMFEFYTGQNIKLTSRYFNAEKRSRWHENACRNLGRFMLEH